MVHHGSMLGSDTLLAGQGRVLLLCLQALTSWGHGYSSSTEEALGAAVNASVDLMCDGMGAAWVSGMEPGWGR